jgi:divalent metal cation (Fe/Co/Zn/Cd) transporter
MSTDICCIADAIAGAGSAHEVHLYRPANVWDSKDMPSLDLVLHTTFTGNTPLSQVHVEAEEIKRALRHAYPKLYSVTIHTEPPE